MFIQITYINVPFIFIFLHVKMYHVIKHVGKKRVHTRSLYRIIM